MKKLFISQPMRGKTEEVVLLPDAHLSKDAMLEMLYCQYIGKPVRGLEGWR